jgi:hypothetical protein
MFDDLKESKRCARPVVVRRIVIVEKGGIDG